MDLLPLAILCVGLLLEALILLRGFLQKSWSRHPFFYSYIAASLIGSVPVNVSYLIHSSSYPVWYWSVQVTTLFLGCGIVLEVFNHVLAPYSGASKFARLVISAGFGTIFCFAIVYSLLVLRRSPAIAEFQLERDLRTLQAIFLGAIIVLISYYRIEIGKSIRGLLLGYVLYIVVSLASMALRSYSGRPFNAWMFIPPLSYDVCLAVWLAALWSYHPDPVPRSGIHLEADYESLVAVTKAAVGTVRAQLNRTVRP
jgi:hypothetical protein